jgi:SPP1 gp7 family putative phage head morphogenesis protein
MAMVAGRSRGRNERVLRPVRPNSGIEADYRRALQALIEEMHRSVTRWVIAAYRAHEPVMAQDAPPFERLTQAQIDRLRQLAEGGDPELKGPRQPVIELERKGFIRLVPIPQRREGELVYELTEAGESIARTLITPAARLRAVTRNLARRWQQRFDEAAPKLAEHFAKAAAQRSAAGLKTILRDGGFSVRMIMTPAMADVLDATVAQNVALIKTIPQRYHAEIEGLVMRSVQTGRDLATLTKDLQERYGVARRRAALIARDQNNKATSALTHARQVDLGITQAVWQHSHAGKEPRPTHVKMSGKTYDVRKGMWDPAEQAFVFPGSLINCRCTSRPVVPGFG